MNAFLLYFLFIIFIQDTSCQLYPNITSSNLSNITKSKEIDLNNYTPRNTDSDEFTVDFFGKLCKNITDCFNCSFLTSPSYSCQWNGTKCYGVPQNNINYERDWRLRYSECTDKVSNSLIKTYCGSQFPMKLNNNKEDDLYQYQILLPMGPHGKYGKQNIVCKWNYDDFDTKNLLYLFMNKTTKAQIGVELRFYGYSRFHPVKEKFVNISIAGVREITFFYHGYKEYTEPPFDIKFNFKPFREVPLVSAVLGLLIILILLFFIVFTVCFYYFYLRIKMNNDYKRANEALEFNANTGDTQRPCQPEENYDDSNRNTKNIEQEAIKEHRCSIPLKKGEMVTKSNSIYQEKYSKFNTNCAICHEEFIMGCQITLLTCSHILHKKCLDNWMKQLHMKFFCPNCHRKSLDDSIGKHSENEIFIHPDANHEKVDKNDKEKDNEKETYIDIPYTSNHSNDYLKRNNATVINLP